ncbi:hypothetical protein ACFVW8_02470 [Streptomyces sp. NPDC058221]|uniref:hypothetical protein n=1 Tax=Streptomyces sp. NPDC058221 TaxID=3346388 RepID=UPI0036F07AAB
MSEVVEAGLTSATKTCWREKRSWTNDGSPSGRSISGFSERRKIKREKSRRGLFLPPLHDDGAEPDMSPSEKLNAALAESKKRRQQRP